MKLPQNLTHSAAADRGEAGRMAHVRATVGYRNQPLSPARRHLDKVADEVNRRRAAELAARKAAEAASRAWKRNVERQLRPAVESLRKAASKISPEALRKMSEDIGRTAGAPDPGEKPAPYERLPKPAPAKITTVPRAPYRPLPPAPVIRGVPPPENSYGFGVESPLVGRAPRGGK